MNNTYCKCIFFFLEKIYYYLDSRKNILLFRLKKELKPLEDEYNTRKIKLDSMTRQVQVSYKGDRFQY